MKTKKILISLIFSLSFVNFSFSQESNPLEISFSSIKTELKNEAVNITLKYLKSLQEAWDSKDYLYTGKKSLISLAPNIDIKTGTSDAFSSINLKATALILSFDTISVAGVSNNPDTSKLFHAFPASLGLETDKNFSTINTIAEFGWVPWYQAAERKDIPSWLKTTKIGFFFQGGYKFKLDKLNAPLVGGEIDESMESIDSGILRLKGNLGFTIKKLIDINFLKIGLVGDSDIWYDLANNETYYRISGKFRAYISKDKYFDFEYQKGSGAPNFNQGDQYGIGLTVAF